MLYNIIMKESNPKSLPLGTTRSYLVRLTPNQLLGFAIVLIFSAGEPNLLWSGREAVFRGQGRLPGDLRYQAMEE